MKYTKNIIWVITIIALLLLSFGLYKTISKTTPVENVAQEQVFDDNYALGTKEFSDGLKKPDSVTKYQLNDFEPGISEKYVYYIDINKDGVPDRITKTFFENWNAHSYYKYFIELNENGKYIDITPSLLQTTNGADCDLRQIQFRFKPDFHIIVIYREMGDTWDTPTMAYKQIFSLQGQTFATQKKISLHPVCDVKELF